MICWPGAFGVRLILFDRTIIDREPFVLLQKEGGGLPYCREPEGNLTLFFAIYKRLCRFPSPGATFIRRRFATPNTAN